MTVTDVVTADLFRMQLRDGHSSGNSNDELCSVRQVDTRDLDQTWEQRNVRFGVFQHFGLQANHRILKSGLLKVLIVRIFQVLICGAICNNADIVSGVELRGQPTEAALLLAADKLGVYDIRNDYLRYVERNNSLSGAPHLSP